MGNDHPQPKKGQSFNKNIDKSKLDILIKQIYFTAQLQKDRKKGQQNAKEKELLAFVREPVNKRNKDNEYSKASSAVNDQKSIKAHELVMRYADILKDNAMVIQLSKGDTSKIMDLVPYVESIIWGCQKCNIDCIKAFEEFIIANFGLETFNQIQQFTKVTPELKSQFSSVLASEKEVKLFLIDFCNRHGISLDVMNEVGHSLSPTELADLPDPDSKPHPNNGGGFPDNQGGFPGNQGGFPGNQGGYPSGQGQGQGQFPPYNPQQGGYPNYGGGYPQQQGGYPNYGGGYPQQGGHPGNQGGYPQQGPGGYPQQGGQGGYSQQGGQGGYPQQGQQGGYPQQQQQGGSYPGFGGYSQQAPHNYQPGNYGGPNNGPSGGQSQGQGGYGHPQGGQGNSYKPPVSQNPTVEINAGLGGNNANQQAPGGESYPDFQKFTNAPQGGKSNDPLDELDLRLRNIKDGL